MEIAASAAGETTKSVISHLERELGYLFHFKRNINNLSVKILQLSAAADDLRRLIHVALSNNELIRETVQAWLTRAETVHEEAIQLVDEAGHIDSWFFKGWCCSRFSVGRKAEKKSVVIQGLLDEITVVIGYTVSIPKPLQSLELVSAGDFNAFSSREAITKQLIKALSDDKISLVGVFGMAGVGKTMLIQTIAKQVKDEKLFQEVVMVTVSQNHLLEKIQGDVAKGLGLVLRAEDTLFTRAAKLSERLNQDDKTILIVLDDVWERIELAAAGIRGLKKQSNKCKIVFTTRDRSVCNQMEVDEDMEVVVLPEDDSWDLFCQKAGKVVVDRVISPRISKEIVQQCKGLPLAIVTLGLTLRNIDDELIWKDALTQLKKSIYEGITPVISSIRLSYDFLQNDTIKLCFLFCCLFPEDEKIAIEVLLTYMIGENVIRNVDSLEETRGRLHSLVEKLTSSNLLLKPEGGYIMMHDVVRDVAISIVSQDNKLGFIVKAGLGLTRWPILLELSNCKRMSVMRNNLRYHHLPHQIKAPHLITLCMRDNYDLEEIPDDLFSGMGSLLTLDLSDTSIRSLPSSMSCLLKLRTLLVENCYLDCISPTEKLESLEILSFRGSSVRRNPQAEDIVNWSSVKLLCLWDLGFPSKALASMVCLEELYMGTTGRFKKSATYIDEVVSHIESLTSLHALEFVTDNDRNFLSRDLPSFENLTRFRLCISSAISFNLLESNFQRLLFLEISPNLVVANWVRALAVKTEVLYLAHCVGIESGIHLDPTGLNDLKYLEFAGDNDKNGLKYLINTLEEQTPKFAFSSLEELHMSEMESFESFCIGMLPDGFLCKLRVLVIRDCTEIMTLIKANLLMRLKNLEELEVSYCTSLEKLAVGEDFMSNKSSSSRLSNCPPSESFPNLRSLSIIYCPLLEYVFTLRLAQGLLQLTELTVSMCFGMKTIFLNDTDEDMSNAEKDMLVLPRLRTLWIRELPQLSTISPTGFSIRCPYLDELRVQKCENLKRLPFGPECTTKLRRLKGDLDWFNKLEWDDERAMPHMREALIQEADDPYSANTSFGG